MSAQPLEDILKELRAIWKNFPVQHMLLFLEVAKNDLGKHEWGVMDIGDRLDINSATVSRGIIDLSSRTTPPGSDGPVDLVETMADKYDHRKRIPILTKKGHRVYASILKHLESAR